MSIKIIVEIGINHNGDLDIAKKLMCGAKEWCRYSKISKARYKFSISKGTFESLEKVHGKNSKRSKGRLELEKMNTLK